MPDSAYSIDGRTFAFEAPLSAAMPVGSYIELTTDAGQRFLGQLLHEEVRSTSTAPTITGGGTLIARLDVDEPVADLGPSALTAGVGVAPASSCGAYRPS